ncbi:hypothetical protein [Thermotoga sp. Ku-13t]|uniref:hypothetical protein n=1 Tax=Thermotoga sp. Ku-13t TaxID=1755813 RepID=UPI0013EDE097|nr:hypothetical protein [Thermotoga sp. Ku-13t]
MLEYMLAKIRHEELLKEAEKERLIREAQKQFKVLYGSNAQQDQVSEKKKETLKV